MNLWQYNFKLKSMKKLILTVFSFAFVLTAVGQKNDTKINQLSSEIESKVIEWRRHIHQNPELSNREFETAKYIAKHLKTLGITVQEGVAKDAAEDAQKQLEAAGGKVSLT